MNKNKLFLVAVAGLSLTACSFDDTLSKLEYDNGAPTELRISSSMSNMTITRGLTDTQNTQMNNDASPAVYVVKTGTEIANYASSGASSVYDYSNVAMRSTAGSLNTSTLAIADQTTIHAFYFPQDKSALDVYLYAPREATNPSLSAMPITVQSNQTSRENYLASDFVFGKATNVAQSTATADVTLFHALTKIKLVIKDNKGNDITGLTSAVLGTSSNKIITDATVNIKADIDNTDETTRTTSLNNAVTLGTTEGIVTLFSDNSSWDNTPIYGIIPPRQNASTIDLTLTIGSSQYTGKLQSSTLTLDAGKMYTFNVALNQSELTITTVEIVDWSAASQNTTVQ